MNNDSNSVDLTEDEDSRDMITDIAETSQLPFVNYNHITGNTPRFKTLSPCTPPPLTPICEINSLRDQRLFGNQLTAVPRLKRIGSDTNNSGDSYLSSQTSSNILLQSLQANTNFTQHTLQDKLSPAQNVLSTHSCKQPGREWTIKKDGKLYNIVIPYNVMPSLENNGCVIVNVPEVGPIMLKLNPYYKNKAVSAVSTLEPFSLNFDEIMESASEPVELQCVTPSVSQSNTQSSVNFQSEGPSSENSLLFDSRFCWIQPRYKNYLFSFKCDFHGFSKTDMQKARRCVRNFTLAIKKLENIFTGKKTESGKKSSKLSQKINTSSKLPSKNSMSDIKQVQFGDMMSIVTQNLNGCHTSNIYNNNMFNPNGSTLYDPNNIDFEDVLSPNVVIDTDDADHGVSLNISENNNMQLQNNCLLSQTSENRSTQALPSSTDNNINSKPCFVKLHRSKLIDNYISNHNVLQQKSSLFVKRKLLATKLIETVEEFKKEILYAKPLLIVNELNFSTVNCELEYKKNNVVFAVDKRKKWLGNILTNIDFFSAIAEGFLKIVDYDLLIRYLKHDHKLYSK